LLDPQTYPAAEFKVVEGWCWTQETYQDRLKNICEVERCSGQSVQTLTQAFSGVIFLATVESILSKPAQAVVRAQAAISG